MNVAARYWQGLSPALRRYCRASVLPSLLFVALAVLHEWSARQAGLPMPWRVVFALAPISCVTWMFACYLRFLRECDELERRIELHALAWAAGLAIHGLVGLLFLLDAGLLAMPGRHLVAVALGFLLVSYALVRDWLQRRYA